MSALCSTPARRPRQGWCGSYHASSLAVLLTLLFAPIAVSAQTPTSLKEVVYRTPLGTTNKFGQDVSALVVVTFAHDGVKVTVSNTTPGITSPEQCITGVSFSVNTKALPHLAATAGKVRVLFSDGFYTADKAQETHWVLSPLGGGKYRLSAPDRALAVISDPRPGKNSYGLDVAAFEKIAGQNPFLANAPTFQIKFPSDITQDQIQDWQVLWGSDPGLYGVDDLTPGTSNPGDPATLGVGGGSGAGGPTDGGGGDFGGGGGNDNPIGPVTTQSLTQSPLVGGGGGGRGGGGGSTNNGINPSNGGTGNDNLPSNITTPATPPPGSTQGTGVPEPLTLGIMGMATVALLSRHRRD